MRINVLVVRVRLAGFLYRMEPWRNGVPSVGGVVHVGPDDLAGCVVETRCGSARPVRFTAWAEA